MPAQLRALFSSKGATTALAALAAASLLFAASRGRAAKPLLAFILSSWSARLWELRGGQPAAAADSCSRRRRSSSSDGSSEASTSQLPTPRENSEASHWRPNRQVASLALAAAAAGAGGGGATAAAAGGKGAAPPSPEFKPAALLAYARLNDGSSS